MTSVWDCVGCPCCVTNNPIFTSENPQHFSPGFWGAGMWLRLTFPAQLSAWKRPAWGSRAAGESAGPGPPLLTSCHSWGRLRVLTWRLSSPESDEMGRESRWGWVFLSRCGSSRCSPRRLIVHKDITVRRLTRSRSAVAGRLQKYL